MSPQPDGLVSLPRALRAELVRTKHSASACFPVAGLVLCLLQGLGWWGVATQPLTGWQQMFSWQSLYATGLAAPLTALLVALTVTREGRARDGGTGWRPLSRPTAFAARTVVLALLLCAFNLVITMPLLLFGWAHGLTNPPVTRLADAWLVLWLGSLLPAAAAFLIARAAGMYVAVGAAIAGQIAGVVQAESPAWLWQPWTWPVRAVLPLLGIHANSTALEADSPIWQQNPWIPIGMSLLLAAALTTAGAVTRLPGRRPRHRTSQRGSHRPDPADVVVDSLPVDNPPVGSALSAVAPVTGRQHRAAAIGRSLRGTGIGPLTAAALAAIVLTGVIWDASYVEGLTTWLVVPLGTCLLACLTWSAQAPAWRTITLRASPSRLGATLLAWCLGILTLIVGTATATVALTGGHHPLRYGILLWTVGAAWLAITGWLAISTGPAAAIAVTLVMLIAGLLFGGTWMAHTNLWLAGPLAWPSSADTWPRAATAIVLAAATTAVATIVWVPALRTAATR